MITMAAFMVWYAVAKVTDRTPLAEKCENIAVGAVIVTTVLDACVEAGLLLAIYLQGA